MMRLHQMSLIMTIEWERKICEKFLFNNELDNEVECVRTEFCIVIKAACTCVTTVSLSEWEEITTN